MQVFVVSSASRSEQFEVPTPDIVRDSVNRRVALRGTFKRSIPNGTVKQFAIEVYITEEEIARAAKLAGLY